MNYENLALLSAQQVAERKRAAMERAMATDALANRRFNPGDSMNYEALARLVDGNLLDNTHCDIPPIGWRCTREIGHSGPCAAVECAEDVALVERGMSRLRESDGRPEHTEVIRLHEENRRMRDALEIIEHTLATLRGEK